MHKNIILPVVLAEQGFKIARQDLWSMLEEHEVTKKNQTLKASARVAREWLLALPYELSNREKIALTEEFATKMANDLGLIADYCIHNLKSDAPASKPISNTADKITDDDDEHNIHAYIKQCLTESLKTIRYGSVINKVFSDKVECGNELG